MSRKYLDLDGLRHYNSKLQSKLTTSVKTIRNKSFIDVKKNEFIIWDNTTYRAIVGTTYWINPEHSWVLSGYCEFKLIIKTCGENMPITIGNYTHVVGNGTLDANSTYLVSVVGYGTSSSYDRVYGDTCYVEIKKIK